MIKKFNIKKLIAIDPTQIGKKNNKKDRIEKNIF
jgi:hypothetical protein